MGVKCMGPLLQEFFFSFNSIVYTGGSVIKNLPAKQEPQETQVLFLGQEVALEEGIATTPVFLPGEFHGQRSL